MNAPLFDSNFITHERNYLFIDVAVMRYISCKRGTNAYNR